MPGAKSITCTQCAAPLEIENPRAKTVVCSHCGAQLDLTSPDYAFLGVVQREPIVAPLKVGQVGHDADGTEWRILGHLRFEEDGYHWDEYLLRAGDGRTFWIQYDDGAFSFYWPRRLKEPVDPLKCTGRFTLEGKDYVCRGFGRAKIERLEGELTWKATVGDSIRWIDAGEIGMEWTDREIEVFDREAVSKKRILEFFGMTRKELEAGCYIEEDPDDEDRPLSASSALSALADDDEDIFDLLGVPPLVKIIILVIIVVLVILFGDTESGGGFYHRGGYSGGGYSFGK